MRLPTHVVWVAPQLAAVLTCSAIQVLQGLRKANKTRNAATIVNKSIARPKGGERVRHSPGSSPWATMRAACCCPPRPSAAQTHWTQAQSTRWPLNHIVHVECFFFLTKARQIKMKISCTTIKLFAQMFCKNVFATLKAFAANFPNMTTTFSSRYIFFE